MGKIDDIRKQREQKFAERSRTATPPAVIAATKSTAASGTAHSAPAKGAPADDDTAAKPSAASDSTASSSAAASTAASKTAAANGAVPKSAATNGAITKSAPAKITTPPDEAAPHQPSRTDAAKKKRGFGKMSSTDSRGAGEVKAKCQGCGKLRTVNNGLIAPHQKGLGKLCAGSRKKPA